VWDGGGGGREGGKNLGKGCVLGYIRESGVGLEL